MLVKTDLKMTSKGHASVRGLVYGVPICVSMAVKETMCRADRYLNTPKPNVCDLIPAVNFFYLPQLRLKCACGFCSTGMLREHHGSRQMDSLRIYGGHKDPWK